MSTKTARELSAIETARRLDVMLDTVYRLIYSNRLPARKGGDGKWLISAEAVEARLKAREERRARLLEE